MKNRYRLMTIAGYTFGEYATAQECADAVYTVSGPGDGFISVDTMPGTVYPFIRYRWEVVGLVGTPYKTMQEAAQCEYI